MKNKICAAIFSASLIFAWALAADFPPANVSASDGRCTVADPTGTALNVRSKPNGGKIVRRLKNGANVFVLYDTTDKQNRAWSKISLKSITDADGIGWVLSEFLDCD